MDTPSNSSSPAASTIFGLLIQMTANHLVILDSNLHHHQKTKNYQWNAKWCLKICHLRMQQYSKYRSMNHFVKIHVSFLSILFILVFPRRIPHLSFATSRTILYIFISCLTPSPLHFIISMTLFFLLTLPLIFVLSRPHHCFGSVQILSRLTTHCSRL